jgi:hypothetical protein
LHHFALCGEVACVELLIESGVDVLTLGENGITPLTCFLVRYEDDDITYQKVYQVLI